MRLQGLLAVVALVLAGCAGASSSGVSRSAGDTGQFAGIQGHATTAAGAAERTPDDTALHPSAGPTPQAAGSVMGRTNVARTPARPAALEQPAAKPASAYCPMGERDGVCAAP